MIRSRESATGSSGQASASGTSTPHTATATTGSAPINSSSVSLVPLLRNRRHDSTDAQTGRRGSCTTVGQDFPGLIPDSPVVYQPVPVAGFELDDNGFHGSKQVTPTPMTPPCCTCPHSDWSWPGRRLQRGPSVPSGKRRGGLEAWLAAIDQVAALNPRVVVAATKTKPSLTNPPFSTRPAPTSSTRKVCSPTNPARASSTTRCFSLPEPTQPRPTLVRRARTPRLSQDQQLVRGGC